MSTLPLQFVIIPGAEWSPAAQRANLKFQTYWQRQSQPHWLTCWVPAEIPCWHSISIQDYVSTHILDPTLPIIVIAFSAGVVGSLALLHSHRLAGLIAVDGWCVPLKSSCLMTRLSHDLDTHWNGLLFGGGSAQFYADPFVSHLDLWGDISQVRGWAGYSRTPVTAGQFLTYSIQAMSER